MMERVFLIISTILAALWAWHYGAWIVERVRIRRRRRKKSGAWYDE